jgi:hypothetical protein
MLRSARRLNKTEPGADNAFPALLDAIGILRH